MKDANEDDPNVTAFNVVQQATTEDEPETQPEKNPAAVALGRLGGLKGGKARAAKGNRISDIRDEIYEDLKDAAAEPAR